MRERAVKPGCAQHLAMVSSVSRGDRQVTRAGDTGPSNRYARLETRLQPVVPRRDEPVGKSTEEDEEEEGEGQLPGAGRLSYAAATLQP